ncbi:hypothetical protein TcWFU_003539 [Taenia crassiceps]|uniref:Uncharacterized protein n=1 Tax=Taenia crassiceps TaxID=6207 RepID=A0ABR4QAY7_9CEST
MFQFIVCVAGFSAFSLCYVLLAERGYLRYSQLCAQALRSVVKVEAKPAHGFVESSVVKIMWKEGKPLSLLYIRWRTQPFSLHTGPSASHLHCFCLTIVAKLLLR